MCFEFSDFFGSRHRFPASPRINRVFMVPKTRKVPLIITIFGLYKTRKRSQNTSSVFLSRVFLLYFYLLLLILVNWFVGVCKLLWRRTNMEILSLTRERYKLFSVYGQRTVRDYTTVRDIFYFW